MKIFFACSTTDIEKHKDTYLHIREKLIDGGNELTRDWLLNYLNNLDAKNVENPSEIYSEVIQSIVIAEAAVFECSVSSMNVGHELTFALTKRKPTLVLIKEEKGKHELFISGSKSPYLTVKQYSTKKELDKIISEFLKENSLKDVNKFNLALDKEQLRYIDWASYYYNSSKTDVIKKAINKLIKSDSDYQESLDS